MQKIKLKIKIFLYWLQILPNLLTDSSFYNYPDGASKKFKLFGKQYIREERKEKASLKKSKTVTYITTLSKIFDPTFSSEDSKIYFSDLVKQTFLWYINYSEELKQKDKNENQIKTNVDSQRTLEKD